MGKQGHADCVALVMQPAPASLGPARPTKMRSRGCCWTLGHLSGPDSGLCQLHPERVTYEWLLSAIGRLWYSHCSPLWAAWGAVGPGLPLKPSDPLLIIHPGCSLCHGSPFRSPACPSLLPTPQEPHLPPWPSPSLGCWVGDHPSCCAQCFQGSFLS